ncbi:hypothetical protein L7F22_056176 [Adiantum nelumboides]|nr:hypothetical protein [Adiantum nelumboides]
MYSLPAYASMAQDYTTQAALYTHHQYIAGFIMTGAFAHGAIFFLRDYDPEQNKDNVLARMLEHKEAIISHLSWSSLFLYVRFSGAIALGLHTTTLILVKGALDARGSKLMPDKKEFGYSFPCDGPGRGETCDISAWDAFYLAVFWMLNTWMGHLLLALETHYSMARKRCSIQRIFYISNGMVEGLFMAKFLAAY